MDDSDAVRLKVRRTTAMKLGNLQAVGMVLLAALVAASMTPAACAQDAVGVERLSGTLKKIKAAGAVTIGFRDASVPFSYLSAARQPIGYSIDLCLAIVESIKGELGRDDIAVKYLPVNPQTRIPLVVEGTVDLECGQTTNNAERRKSVAFSPIIFVSGTKLLVKRTSKLRSYRDLKGQTVAVTEGTTNEAAVNALNTREGIGVIVMPVRENDQAFQAVVTGKAAAWAGDDVVLYATAAEAPNPRDFSVLGDYVSYDPYGIMYRKNDPAFDALVKRTFEEMADSRELARIYEQWFVRKLPSGRTLGIAMSLQLQSIFEALGQPTE
jgi:glutamate/aspartate transport system substrate-binding protein